MTTCILVTTGTGTYDNGYLDLYVNTGIGYVEVTTPNTIYEKGSEVLNQCYTNLIGVQVTNRLSNAWAGSIVSSLNNGGLYSPMRCQDCTGVVDTTEYIVVDGNSDGQGDTKCLNGGTGNICTLITPVCDGSNQPTYQYDLDGTICDCSVCIAEPNGLPNIQGPEPLCDDSNVVVSFFALGDSPYDRNSNSCFNEQLNRFEDPCSKSIDCRAQSETWQVHIVFYLYVQDTMYDLI